MPTSDRRPRDLSREAIRKLREVLTVLEDDVAHEEAEQAEDATRKAYDAAERRAVKRAKAARYGKEVFAVPALASYPLTKDRKPDAERVRAAWDYIHVAANRAKLGEPTARQAEARIRAFAHRHFPDMALEADDTRKSWATDEVYVFPAERVWPLTDRRTPSVAAVQKAWQEVHSARWEYLLTDDAMARAEARILAFAAQHQLPVRPERTQKGWAM